VEVFSPLRIQFIDEIHRFSKSQQDSLLAVEKGWITLIGAENPSFEVIPALLSVVKFMY
jgi:putative ATPase